MLETLGEELLKIRFCCDSIPVASIPPSGKSPPLLKTVLGSLDSWNVTDSIVISITKSYLNFTLFFIIWGFLLFLDVDWLKILSKNKIISLSIRNLQFRMRHCVQDKAFTEIVCLKKRGWTGSQMLQISCFQRKFFPVINTIIKCHIKETWNASHVLSSILNRVFHN